MDITKFNNFISGLGYSLPSGFNYSIDVGSRIRFTDKNKKVIIKTYGFKE